MRRRGSETLPGGSRIQWAQVVSLGVIMIAVSTFWSTPAVYPLKVLVVFFHELSHGLAALLTGGRIVEIEVVRQEGGMCVTSGGNRFLILSAGYLGSLFWGGTLLLLATRTTWDRAVATLTGGILLAATVIWVRPVASFGFAFGVLSGVALVGAGKFLRHSANEYLLKLIGLTSCLYAVLDIKSDTLDRPQLPSDARLLSAEIGMPALFWGLLWGGLALALAFGFLVVACRKGARGASARGSPRGEHSPRSGRLPK